LENTLRKSLNNNYQQLNRTAQRFTIQQAKNMSVVVKELTKIYGQQKAIDSISFQLKKGEIVGFIGPNGSGKSTTMKSICGILTPTSGQILINNTNIAESINELKKNIGYLPENNPLYYDQYIEEYLRYVGKMYKVKQLSKRVKDILNLTGLTPERKKKIGQLSKGYKQRVGLAQALIHDPQILILDEPTTGLDPNQLVEIREVIKTLGSEKTVLLSTHILQEVEAICHRVIMINNGKIVADKTTEEVQQNNSIGQIIKVEFKEIIDSKLFKTIANIDTIKQKSETCFFLESHSDIDLREQIFNFAKINNLSILEMQTQKRSLEDTFKELSGKK
jgi:ABC-2 type transport system ATP-binding protein